MKRLALVLTLALGLAGPVLAQRAPSPLRVTTSLGTLPYTETPDTAVALQAPTFAGLFVNGPQVVIQVTDTGAASQAAVLGALHERRGPELAAQGLTLEGARFELVRYSALELAQARYAAWGIRGWNSIGTGNRENRVKVSLSLPEYLEPAQAHLRAQGIPLDLVTFTVPQPRALPLRTTWTVPHRAALQVPRVVAQGDILPINFWITSTGAAPVDLDVGLCSALRWQVINARGQVVRPAPGDNICPSVLQMARLKMGESINLTRPEPQTPGVYWDLRDPSGSLLPPGTYTLQAAMQQGTQVIRPADVPFTVRPAAPDGGVEAAIRAFWFGHYLGAPEREPRFVIRQEVQLLELAVPDDRAKRALMREAQDKGISLARVRFVRQPTPPVPPVGQATQATLKVSPLVGGEQRQSHMDLRLNPRAATQLIPQAVRCEFVTVVLNAGGEVVDWTRQTRFSRLRLGPPEACPRGDTLHLGLSTSWNGRLSDGQLAPPGRYQVRAGLQLIQNGGRVAWLSAPAGWLTVP
ncbi:hypothetical protein [Deinococcus aquaedulcis]|uniref:hypothetical protein n=1 Tax=Deinococcus aquaedulcis TaxID=2840455 RepID=UPI001C837697|nr:hypothetical protein [Deinococcus aquaedulcis]